MPKLTDARALTVLAWLNVTLHALALVLALIGMRPGSPLVALPERLHYLASNPPGWSLGWGTWMLCTLALIAYFAALAHQLQDHGPLPQLAVILAAAGGAIDLLCDAIYITVLPQLASRPPPPEEIFLAVERTASVGGLIVANGLYAMGTLLLTVCLRRRQPSGSWIVPVGYGVFGFGMFLVIAGFMDEPRLAEMGTGPTIGLYCLWTVLVARSMNAGGGQP